MQPENMNPIQPTNKGHRILVLTLVILLTAGVMGGGVYYVLNQQMKKQDKLIEELQKTASNAVTEKEEKKTETPVVKDETADWKTYSSAEYGYSIKYPKEYFLKEIGADNLDAGIGRNIIISNLSNPGIQDFVEGQKFSFDVRRSSATGYTLDSFFKERHASNDQFKTTKIGITKFGSFDAIKYKTDDTIGNYDSYGLVVLKGSYVYQIIGGTSSDQKLSDYETTFEAMINSFKFTN